MGESRSLKVDIGELCPATEDSSWEHTFYLDPKEQAKYCLCQNMRTTRKLRSSGTRLMSILTGMSWYVRLNLPRTMGI